MTTQNKDPEGQGKMDKGDDKGDDKTKTPEIDPKIAEIMKDPDAVANLLSAKRSANEEAKKYRLKLEELESAKKAREDETLKEQGKYKELAEKAKNEREADRASFKAQRIALEIRLEAARAGMADPDDAAALCDKSKITVSDDFSTVTGAKEAVEELRKSKTYLFRKEGAPPPADNPKPDLHKRKEGDEKLTPLQRIQRGLSAKK